MESTKMQMIYQQMSSNELIELIGKSEYTDEAKLTAINILEERGELTNDLQNLKDSLMNSIETESKISLSFNKYYTFWPRFLSAIIDGLLFSLLGYLIRFAVNGTTSVATIFDEFATTILPYFYSIILHGFFGQTIGKMLMDVKVFDKDENTKLTFLQAILRDIIPFSLMLIFFLLSKVTIDYDNTNTMMIIGVIVGFINVLWTMIEIFTMLTNSKRRALHDYIAGTIVLKIEK